MCLCVDVCMYYLGTSTPPVDPVVRLFSSPHALGSCAKQVHGVHMGLLIRMDPMSFLGPFISHCRWKD